MQKNATLDIPCISVSRNYLLENWVSDYILDLYDFLSFINARAFLPELRGQKTKWLTKSYRNFVKATLLKFKNSIIFASQIQVIFPTTEEQIHVGTIVTTVTQIRIIRINT